MSAPPAAYGGAGADLDQLSQGLAAFLGGENSHPLRPTREPERSTDTRLLDQCARDLTRMAADGQLDPVIGREEELTRVIQILSRRTKNNPVLIGEPGVGKTAIVEGLALAIADGTAPSHLLGRRVSLWTYAPWWRAPSTGGVRGEAQTRAGGGPPGRQHHPLHR